MTTAAFNLAGLAEFWRVARRLHTIYAELDRTFELGTPACLELEQNVDRSEPAVLERVCRWFESIDAQVQVWQLRQLLQSTNLQSEENLRYLIRRHLEKKERSDADKEKVDFLLVQYFAHCAPQGTTEHHVTLEGVARVLEPALGEVPDKFPKEASLLDEKLKKMSQCTSLEELQDSGALNEAREIKAASGEHYFDAAFLVAFTRFNFLARRAFFRAMHVDLHAIRAAVNELESRGVFALDCREAGLGESESLEQVRHLVHQWKTPFRAPYSAGGSSFQQLIQLRQALNRALAKKSDPSPPAKAEPAAPVARAPQTKPQTPPAAPKIVAQPVAQPAVHVGATPKELEDEEDYLQRCQADIAEQLSAVAPKSTPGVSTIHLAGCKLMIATWEAEAFRSTGEIAATLQRAVAARTILHVCIDRRKKHEATDLAAALEIARLQAEEMKQYVVKAKEQHNIDAAVNLAATAKRLLGLVDEGQKLLS